MIAGSGDAAFGGPAGRAYQSAFTVAQPDLHGRGIELERGLGQRWVIERIGRKGDVQGITESLGQGWMRDRGKTVFARR